MIGVDCIISLRVAGIRELRLIARGYRLLPTSLPDGAGASFHDADIFILLFMSCLEIADIFDARPYCRA
jgi:hypothetical protein